MKSARKAKPAKNLQNPGVIPDFTTDSRVPVEVGSKSLRRVYGERETETEREVVPRKYSLNSSAGPTGYPEN